MPLDTEIVGTNLDAGGNVKVALPLVPAQMGGVRMFSENDSGSVTGAPSLRSPHTSRNHRLRTGVDTILFQNTFNATTQNTHLWHYVFATLTAAQPGAGTVNFSAVQGSTSAHGAFLRSYQYFALANSAPLAVECFGGLFTAPLTAGEVFLMGLGLPASAVVRPTDGAWWKATSAGIVGVLAFNGVEVETGVLSAQTAVGTMHSFVMVVDESSVDWRMDDVLLASQPIPSGVATPWLSGSAPVFMHKYNTGSVTNTNQVRIGRVAVSLRDVTSNKPWSHQMSGMGQHLLFGPNGHTQGKTSLWTNNTAPTAVALTNTAAAFTGLGGIVAVLPTLAVNSDGIVYSYQNPVGTVNITGRNMYITRVTLKGMVSVILAGGPVVYAYALAVGHTAVSLATTETATFATATTHAPRIMPLGIEKYILNAPVGDLGDGFDVNFDTPICVRPGEFVALLARNLGVVTTTGAITMIASVGGYWE